MNGPRGGEFDFFHRPLTSDGIPEADAPWYPDVAEFALSFDGYEALGTFDRVADLYSRVRKTWDESGALPPDLIELRTTLFFLQRSLRWNDNPFDTRSNGMSDRDFVFSHSLIEAIRSVVQRPFGDSSTRRRGS